jgi:hypothetical protein
MRPLSAFSVVLLAAITWLRAAAAAKPEHVMTMTGPELLMILSDPRGPEMTVSSLSDIELTRLLDALYQNLDTSKPEPSTILWYEIGVEESLRRNL